MKAVSLLAVLTAGPAMAERVAVPSGQPVEFVERLIEADNFDGMTWRFRFVAPQIARDGGTMSLETTIADMDALCAGFALSRFNANGVLPKQVIISFADKRTEYGIAAPDVTQFFEAYAVENGTCIWKGF
jgi:hypothetical protein